MWLPRCQGEVVDSSGSREWLCLLMPPVYPSSQLSPMSPTRIHGAHSRPTCPFSLASSPIKMYYYRLTSCFPSTICLSTGRNSSSQKATLHYSGILLPKQQSPTKKGGKSENKNSSIKSQPIKVGLPLVPGWCDITMNYSMRMVSEQQVD